MPVLNFIASTTPSIKPGTCKLFIILAEVEDHIYGGKKLVFPAFYLNEYPIFYQNGCGQDICTAETCHMANGDGCPTNGWFTAESSFDYDYVYERVTHTILAFATLPDANTVMAELGPLS